MTLSEMIAVHDETALAALVSVGVVRRAKRDFEAGKAAVESRDEAAATVTADGKTVMIPASGLTAATCNCPATGICRHILLATFALREDASVEAAPVTSAADELHALDEVALRKFAGADWDKAINLARISGRATLTEDGANLSVQLPDVEFPVVFLAGQGLAGAVFKGAKTAKRRMAAAAALIARAQSGAQALDQVTQDEDKVAQMSPAFLGKVQSAITALVTGVFGGGAVVAEDLVFDLSISARAQSAPRLTALLRGLVQQSRQYRAHHIDFREDRFLADASRAYALAKALEAHPQDTQLTGTLRRNYRAHDDLDLVMLGAVQWTAASGARGLRVYGYAPQEGTWYTTGQARAAGMDPGFSPRNAYDAPLWSGGIARELMGAHVHLQQARVSEDNQIAWDHGSGTRLPMPDLIQAAFQNWAEARADIARRASVGLRGTGAPVPVLLAPAHIGDAQFHDLDQRYEVSVADQNNAAIAVTIPADQHTTVAWLQSNKAAVRAMLCEVTAVDLRQQLTLVAVLFKAGDGTLAVMNLTLDQQPQKKTAFGDRALSFLKDKVRFGGVGPGALPAGQVSVLCHAVFDSVAEVLRFGKSPGLGALTARADDLQLALLAQALRDFEKETTADQAMRVSYLAAQAALAA
ncbi:hypothetical protein MWU60_17105 [Yoonia sp. F2084L]|uniref:hypothetical protein n=1 Tax=Yoonia sp. F2084L TaxID=2926419 RepID=UPI001FF5619D|nr:hypothetical protein [Yoonia sp. F2084L]MCK0097299.1 hypothetical protein [Yoonia sp. F2084L]